MPTWLEEIQRRTNMDLRDDPQVQRLMAVFRDQLAVRGRAHHRALLAKMRGVVPNPATEPMQEFALALKGKLRFFAPKAPSGKEALGSGETLAYFPGCLTTESAREYDASIRLVAKNLGISFEEIPGWRCCGGGVVQDVDPDVSARSLSHNTQLAGNRTIVSGCPICVARTQAATPDAAATHLLGILTRPDLLAKLKEKIKSTGETRPVGSLKVACFYGCELQDRALWAVPSTPGGGEGRGEGAVESPIELLMEAAGATVMKWGGLKRCCGGYLLYARPELGFEMLEKVFRDFEKSGADAIVTACPHCHFNLDAFQFTIGRSRKRAVEAPVFHVTEVLALAMNLDVERGLDRHVTSVLPLIDRLAAEEGKRRREARLKRKGT